MTDRVKDRIAFVTGAGSGIGLASALRMAEEGAKVALVDVRLEALQNAEAEFRAAGADYLLLEADITKETDIENAFAAAVRKWGRIDIVFANAGINGTWSPIETIALEEWNRTIHTNLTGTFLTVKHAIPHMKEHGGSIIINSSINGNRTYSGFGRSPYGSAKAGQVAFMKMAALELARYKIRVNAVCPGAIETNINDSTDRKEEVAEIEIPVEFPEGDHPLKGAEGEPRQVANLVLFLASDESDHVTGSDIYIDGAESLLRG